MKTPTETCHILDLLEAQHPDADTELHHSNAFELLVATILSAQCTDERVNAVTPGLFARYPDASSFAFADIEALETLIHSCGFYRNKAKNIRAAAQAVVDRFGGDVPRDMEELLTLPGVARKTANVVLSHAYGINEGIAVDTHVQRLSRRLGLTEETDPVRIEMDLMAVFDRNSWERVSDVLIWHGRRVCAARRPQCEICVLNDICPSSTIRVAPVPGDGS